MVRDLAAEPFHAPGDERRRPAEDHLGAQLVRPQMLERATREWLMSPIRPTVRPSICPWRVGSS